MQQQESTAEHSNTEHGDILTVTVLVDGTPQTKHYPASEKVHAVIVSLLPPGEKAHADKYMLTDTTQSPPKVLAPEESLKHGGVKSGHVLTLDKKDGGGGTS